MYLEQVKATSAAKLQGMDEQAEADGPVLGRYMGEIEKWKNLAGNTEKHQGHGPLGMGSAPADCS